jgi:hypothetical protein
LDDGPAAAASAAGNTVGLGSNDVGLNGEASDGGDATASVGTGSVGGEAAASA